MAARVIIGVSSINLTDISQEQATVILSYESSQALYSYLNLQMIAFIDMNSKNQWFYNTTTTSDQYTSNFYKNKFDTSNLLEDEYLSFGKALTNTSNLSDSFYRVVQYRRSFLDDTRLLDSYDKSFFKALSDQPNLSDVARRDTTKLLLNEGDVLDLYESSFIKTKGDSFSLQDTVDTIGFFKNVEDAAGFSDIETVAFAKYLFDTVSLTDDVDGAASVLDDQEMNYFKFVSNIAKTTDTFSRVVSFVREYADTSSITEDSVFTLNKNLEEAPSVSDDDTLSVFKALNKTASVSDSLAITLLLAPFIDSPTISDLYSGNLGKLVSSATSLADTGSLRSQGYSDFSYFEEDYVGSSRIF